MSDNEKLPRWLTRPSYRDPALRQVLACISELTAAQIERKCGVTAGTIRRWRKPVSEGGTRRPQNVTMDFALRAAGFKRIIVPVERKR